ncbi:MAG: hypothetical protein CMD39_07435 [Gammaproteobacteria bacterium]|nr:hypothetical protein [Gammaproteobacteria bacterium]
MIRRTAGLRDVLRAVDGVLDAVDRFDPGSLLDGLEELGLDDLDLGLGPGLGGSSGPGRRRSPQDAQRRRADPFDDHGIPLPRAAALRELGFAVHDRPTPDELRAAFRRRARLTHPDNGGNAEDFRRVCRARDRLAEDLQENAC